ncbi:histidine kinase [Brachybacterium sp. p3-SID1565]|uniref:sensor histidine kinase n=1 Tax=Brachybacterium sp. p3-SID1565 TaxID=2916046 RepID=UPI0021A82B5C|nr:histidine kinase [Brachybacterium sp. p3-SID1565]MCT1384517.1 histidine kinase [Brachybacterium sp. p3-SID1565]
MPSPAAPETAGPRDAHAATGRPPRPRIEARDVLVAVGYALLAVVLAFTGISNSGFLTQSWGLEVSLPLMLVAAAATLWRRRAPVVTLVVTGLASLAEAIAGGQITAYVLLFEALFTPVIHGSRQLARATTGIAIAASVAAILVAAVVTGSVELVFVVMIVVALVTLTPLLWGWEVRHHREARRTAEALARSAAALARTEHDLAQSRQARAVEGERRRIAHDLHDVIAGHLSAVTLHTSLASSLEDAGARDNSLLTARDSAKAALRDLQSMITVLSTEEPGALPQATLDWDSLTARLRGRDPHLTARIDPAVSDPEQVDPSVQAALLRIASEAVTNAVRHGQAPISLRVAFEPAGLEAHVPAEVGAPAGVDGATPVVHLVLENRIGDRAETGTGTDAGLGVGTGLGIGAIGHRAAAVGGTAHAGPVHPGPGRSAPAHAGAARDVPPASPGTWRVEARLPARPASALAAHPDQEVPA